MNRLVASIACVLALQVPLRAEPLPVGTAVKWKIEGAATRVDLVVNDTGAAVMAYRICQFTGLDTRINTADGGRPTTLSKGVCLDVVAASSIWLTRANPADSETAEGSLALIYAGMIGGR